MVHPLGGLSNDWLALSVWIPGKATFSLRGDLMCRGWYGFKRIKKFQLMNHNRLFILGKVPYTKGINP
jgi:hypothetical protein